MERPMQGLQKVADEITRRLETGEIQTSLSSADRLTKSPLELTPDQIVRRETIKHMILRYQVEKNLAPYSDDDLHDIVVSFDEHFTYARIPTLRIRELYLEAMAHHGPYLLKIDDYLRAWDRIKPSEYAGVDTRDMHNRPDCSICQGKGITLVYDPATKTEIEKECPYHCKVVTALEKQ